MANRRTGNGIIYQRVVTLTTTPQRLTHADTNDNPLPVDALVVQMAADAAVDVRIGGPGVTDTVGFLLLATPDTTPATKPDEFVQNVTSRDVWARTVSGTCDVVVLEVY